MSRRLFPALFLLLGSLSASAQLPVRLELGKPLAKVQPTMYGIFLEDINFAADGGLYGELVKNRSFEFPDPLQGWKCAGRFEVRDDGPFENAPHYVRLHAPLHPAKATMMENEGFFGMGIQKGHTYRLTFWARLAEGTQASVKAVLVDAYSQKNSQRLSEPVSVIVSRGDWTKYAVELSAFETAQKAQMRLSISGASTAVDFEHISLFDKDSWKGRQNGMRKDLAQALYDLHPGVFRFPGGCIVEGTDLTTRYSWKNSILDIENRPLNESRWLYNQGERQNLDVYQSYGLGFYDFFLLSEDIGAEPLPVLNCGMACQFENEGDEANAPLDSLQAFIDDALDLIEFANGGADTKWGARRASMGHPEPFGLKYLAIGNEQWGEGYVRRLRIISDAVRKAHPEIVLVGGSGPYPQGDDFDMLWKEMGRMGVDLVDEHFYKSADWFFSQATRYDGYDRKGPAVFAGEYACHDGGRSNHWWATLSEAAFMTGLERNADLVHMATYAPLLAHVDGWQWRPDLIWYDNLRLLRTSSYYLQQLFSLYKGTDVLSLTMDGAPIAGDHGVYASAVWDSESGRLYVKTVNPSSVSVRMDVSVLPKGKAGREMAERISGADLECVTLSDDDILSENSLENPDRIVPRKASVGRLTHEGLQLDLQPFSMQVWILTP